MCIRDSYYGMNALSHNVIMADRKKLKSANGMYLGSTGSGKSFAAKRELLNVFLTIPQDRIIVVEMCIRDRAQAVRPAPIKEQMAEAAKQAGKENAARPAPAKAKEARNDR